MNILNNLINMVPLDVQSGLTQAKDTVIEKVRPIVNTVAVPIILVVLATILLFMIASCVKKHRNGDGYSDKLTGIGILIAIIVLVSTWPAWGWSLIA